VTRDLHDLARSVAALPDALQRGQKAGVNKSALHVTRAIRGNIRAVTGDNRLSGVGRRGARVGARYNVKGTVNPTALITAVGPLHLIERDTRPHDVAPRKRGGRKALKFANGTFAASAHASGGSKGKRPFGRGVDATKNDTGRIFNEAVWAQVERVFR
jgi:hypothetical protein